MEMHYPVEVKPLDNYKLHLVFNNGEQRIFDVAPYLSRKFFAPLSNTRIFHTVKISPVSIEWEGGIDMCPDELYYDSVPVNN